MRQRHPITYESVLKLESMVALKLKDDPEWSFKTHEFVEEPVYLARPGGGWMMVSREIAEKCLVLEHLP